MFVCLTIGKFIPFAEFYHNSIQMAKDTTRKLMENHDYNHSTNIKLKFYGM